MVLKDFLTGLKSTLPFMVGVIPFGLAYGIMGIQSGLSVFEITFMSMVVFAGSAQFMAVEMISKNIGFAFIIFSTILINLRHLLMGFSLSQYLKKLSNTWLYGLAFGMVDEVYTTSINYYQHLKTDEGSPYFMLGSASGMYLFWVVSSAVGGVLGMSIKDPLSWGLDFAMPATFLSMLVSQIKSIRVLIVVLVAGICTIFISMCIPGNWYIIIATIIATAVGAAMEEISERRVVI